MSQENNFVCKIEMKEEKILNLHSSCYIFAENVVNDGSRTEDTDSFKNNINDDDFVASIEETMRSVSEINLLENFVFLDDNETHKNLDVNSVLNIEIPQKDYQFSDIVEPPLKRVKYGEDILKNMFIDDGLQTTNRIRKNLEKTICHKKIQTDNPKHYELETSCGLELKKNSSSPIIEDLKLILSKRKKRVSELSSSINEASHYLDEIRKILSAPKDSPISTILPAPPKFLGYENQFDFPKENRFCKIPILIENRAKTKYPRTVRPFKFCDHKSSMAKISVKKGTKNNILAAPLKSSGRKNDILSRSNKENQMSDAISFRRI